MTPLFLLPILAMQAGGSAWHGLRIRQKMTFAEFLDTYKITLNEQQLLTVQSVDGPALLLAVPGSGKTTVLVTRLGYMIYCRNIAPEKILTLTYTVAATRDMADRFEQIFGSGLRDRLEFRTINGVCAKIINYYGRLIGKTAFQLVTDEKSNAGLLSAIFQKVENNYPTESDLKNVRTWITYIKNRMLSEKEILELEEEAGFQIGEIYRCYCSQMRRQGLMDYDDQMIYALNILRRNPETLRYFRSCYPYICVDEAQDTSKIQHTIIALLAGEKDNLFMVGDEDQSIYGFRAAYPEALLSFEKNHPGAKVLLMEENYRSNAKIVDAADRFIQKNTMRHEKHMRASREEGTDIRKIPLKSRKAQYSYLEKAAAGCKTRTAVLYRDNESVLPLVDRLERKGIPYRIRSAELSFFTHRVVLDIQNIIRFAMDPKDTDLFMQIYYKINLYINKENAVKFCEISRRRNMPVLETAAASGRLPGYTVGNIRAMQTHLAHLLQEPAEKAINRIVNLMGYASYLERAGMGDSKLYVLRALAAMEDSPEHFLNRMEELQRIIREKENDPKCQFILSTIHASKGLEYDTVYLLDVADGIFPENIPDGRGKNAAAEQKEREDYEEERRIFYVGITRAKNQLNLFGLPIASAFLRDLMPEVKKQPSDRTSTDRSMAGNSRMGQGRTEKSFYQTEKPFIRAEKSFSQAEYEAFCDSIGEGIGVIHKTFGHGIVAEMEGDWIIVQFADTRRKLLLPILFSNGILKVES